MPSPRRAVPALLAVVWISAVKGADREFNCFYHGPTCRDCLAFDYCAWCTEGVAEPHCVDVARDASGNDFPMHPADTCTWWVRKDVDQCEGEGFHMEGRHGGTKVGIDVPEPEPEIIAKADPPKASVVVKEEPPTKDSECSWHYSKLACHWEDYCEYRYKFGDITLDESCRLIKHDNKTHHIPTKDEECKWQYGKFKCKYPDTCEYHYQFGDMTLGTSCRMKTHPKPTGDSMCQWDLAKAKCKDPEVCEYRFEMGDMALGQSCRLKAESSPKKNDECKWDYAKAECAWKGFCEYHYWVGDITLDQSCVLIGSREDNGRVPTDDDECKWDYKGARCAFPSVCGWHFQMGDILLSESCRLTANHKHIYDGPAPVRDGDCDWDYGLGHCEWPEFCSFQYKFGDMSLSASCRILGNVTRTPGKSADMMPASDGECKWEYAETRCAWPEKCFYKMCVGDMTLGASCRLRSEWQAGDGEILSGGDVRTCSTDKNEEPPKEDEGCVWDYAGGTCKYPGMCQFHFCPADMTLTQSCRLAIMDRNCNQTKAAMITVERGEGGHIPQSNDECKWDYAEASCQWPRYCHYNFCLGDMTLDQSCRIRKEHKQCQEEDDRLEYMLRNQRLKDARIKRLRIEKRANERQVVWDKVLKMLREAEDKSKFDGGADQYDAGLKLVSWAEKAAMLNLQPRWVDAKKVGKEPTRVVSALEPQGVIAEQARKADVEKVCKGKCISYMGHDFWSQCFQQCLFSTR